MKAQTNNIRTYIAIGIALVALTFTSCHEDTIYEGPRDVRIRAFIQQRIDVSRAYSPLDATYNDFTAGAIITLGNKQSQTKMEWDGTSLQSSIRLEEGNYWFYAYSPWNEQAQLGGRHLTIPNIDGLNTKDVLVAKAEQIIVNKDDKEVHTSLYMDHMMAKVTPHFYLDETYAQLRSIEVTKIEFKLPACSRFTSTIVHNPTAGSYTVSWTRQFGSFDAEVASDPTTIPAMLPTQKADAVPFGGCYVCPNQPIDDIALRVTYNVYDTAGEPTRENVTAENSIIRLGGNLEAGKNYNLYIKIVPSYLYVLSDNDMESSFVIL